MKTQIDNENEKFRMTRSNESFYANLLKQKMEPEKFQQLQEINQQPSQQARIITTGDPIKSDKRRRLGK